jgi:hypothetical protein
MSLRFKIGGHYRVSILHFFEKVKINALFLYTKLNPALMFTAQSGIKVIANFILHMKYEFFFIFSCGPVWLHTYISVKHICLKYDPQINTVYHNHTEVRVL